MENLRSAKIEAFTTTPVIASSKSSVSEIIGQLKNNDVYEVFVEDGGKLGVVTMREILKTSDIFNMKASSLVFSLSKISPDDTVAKAARLMTDYRMRSLPVSQDRTIEGAVTAQSLCRTLFSTKEFGNIAIDKLMKRSLITVNKHESVSKARSLMINNGIDHLPVLDAGKLCGMLLSSQIVFMMFPREKLRRGASFTEPAGYSEFKVAGLMSQEVLVCAPEEKARGVLSKMVEQKKSYALVKLWDELQGIATYRDFVGLLAEPEELDIPAYVVGLPDDPFEAHLAKTKFFREAKTLRKSFPTIHEIRATIKTKKVSSGKQRHEVSVSITTPHKIHAYSAEGWDLPLVFDEIGDKMKRLLTKKAHERRRESIRKIP